MVASKSPNWYAVLVVSITVDRPSLPNTMLALILASAAKVKRSRFPNDPKDCGREWQTAVSSAI